MSPTTLIRSLAVGAWVAFTAAAASADGESAPVRVELLTEATTPGTRIRLADLVPENQHARLSPELLAIDLGRAPSSSFARHVDRRLIEASLPDGALELTGPDAVIVTSDLRRVSDDEIGASADSYLVALLAGADAELDLQKPAFAVFVPRGREMVELRPRRRSDGPLRNTVTVYVDIVVDGRVQRSVPVSFRIRAFAPAPVLTRSLFAGEPIRDGDVEIRRVEIDRPAGWSPPRTSESWSGWVARRSVTAGTVVADRDFELPVVVKRNQPVTLMFRTGGLRAECFGIARGSGRVGDMVKVENLTTKKIVVGTIENEGLVRVHR